METKETKGSNDLNQASENVVIKNKMRNARKEGLTKGALTTGIISFILLVGLGLLIYSVYKREYNSQLALMENQKQIFTNQLTERDSMINVWLVTFDEIEKNLNAIKQKENLLTVKASDTEFSKDKRNQVLEDIRDINSLIDENKKKIAKLSAQLKESGVTMKGLENRIAGLEESMRLYENQISELKTTLVNKDFEIGQLNDRMIAMNDTILLQEERITVQTEKLNQAFLAFGTYKDLKGKGIIYKEGGFLGLGRKESLIEDFNDSLFTAIDVTKIKTIPVNSKDVKLITEHPTNSYELVRENEKQIAYIEIKDPEEFWRISKYAVVEIIR